MSRAIPGTIAAALLLGCGDRSPPALWPEPPPPTLATPIGIEEPEPAPPTPPSEPAPAATDTEAAPAEPAAPSPPDTPASGTPSRPSDAAPVKPR